MKTLDDFFEKEIESGTFPGAVLLVGDSKEIIFQRAYGYRSLKPKREKNDIGTIYDVASMTKVIATTSAIMRLVESGEIRLYDPVHLFIDGFNTEKKRDVRIWHLLTHTSGLPAYSDAWKHTKGREELLKSINNIELSNHVGEKFVYSCLNFITLMEIVENVTQKSFDEFVKHEIFSPLKMEKTTFNPPKTWITEIAPTSERDGDLLRGKVDDELAYYLGGVSGNAGLFSTAEDIYKFASMLMNKGVYNGERIFSEMTVTTFTKEAFSDGTVRRALGWDMKTLMCSCGDLMSDKSYGHTGFTGTSVWIDPMNDVVIVLLTNRVHISRWENQEKIIRFRPRLHNYVLSHLRGVKL